MHVLAYSRRVLFHVFFNLAEFKFTAGFLVVNSLFFYFTGKFPWLLISWNIEFSGIFLFHGTHAARIAKLKWSECITLSEYFTIFPAMVPNVYCMQTHRRARVVNTNK